MEKEHKVFLAIGIPIWILTGILLLYSFFPGILFSIIEIIAFYFAIVHGKKTHRSIYWFKIGMVMTIIGASSFLYLVSLPDFWVRQYTHNLDPNQIITPQDSLVLELKARFESWIGTRPNITNYFATYFDDGLNTETIYREYYIDSTNTTWVGLDDLYKSVIIDYYIRSFIVSWTSDQQVYGVQDYWATPHEILQQLVKNNWTAPAQDDCDGIAAVTVSLLRSYNISAYLGTGIGHMFSVVFLPNETLSTYGFKNAILLNYWDNSYEAVHFWGYFDNSKYVWVQNPIDTFRDLILLHDTSEIQPVFDFFNNYQWVIYPALALISIIFVLFIGYPRSYDNSEENELRSARRQHLNEKHPWTQNRKNPLNWVLHWTYVRTGNPFRKVYRNEWLNIIILFCLLLIPVQILLALQNNLSQYTEIYLYIYLWILIFSFDRDFFVKLKDKISKIIWKSKQPSVITQLVHE